jgi:hypothetical protein
MAIPPWEDIDADIRPIVKVLYENGIETTESCQGGQGHPFPEPTVRFCGGHAEGFKAFAIAREHGIQVTAIRRAYSVQDNEPVGPEWEMTFHIPGGSGAYPVDLANGTVSWEWR